LKTPAFRFRVDGKNFENRAFRKRWRYDYHLISLSAFSPTEHTTKITGDRCVFFKFLRRRVDGKHLMCFQSET